jgi:hypothetical protein
MNKTERFAQWPYRWFGFFSEDHDSSIPPVDEFIDQDWRPSDWEQLANYVAHAPVVLASAMLPVKCPLCDESYLDPGSYSSDGEWLWPTSLAHYVTRHYVRPPDALIEHIRKNGFKIPADITVEIQDLPWPNIEIQ